jgi:hypothetical protein
MLEIIALVTLGRLIYDQAEARGLPPILFVLAFVGMSFGCEFIGMLLAILFGPPGIGMLCGMYTLSLMGAAVGGGIVFAIVAFYPRYIPPRREEEMLDYKDFFKRTVRNAAALKRTMTTRKSRRGESAWMMTTTIKIRRRAGQDEVTMTTTSPTRAFAAAATIEPTLQPLRG